MARSQEIPNCIKEIEPQYRTISVMPYSRDNVFLPNGEALEDFKSDTASRLQSYQDASNTPNQIFVYDFKGITSIEPDYTKAGLRYIFSSFRGQKEKHSQTYSIFDGLSAEYSGSLSLWEKFRSTLQGMAVSKPVVMARKQARSNYILLGSEDKVLKFLDLCRLLSEKQSWVHGGEFSREYPIPTATITLQNLFDVYNNGLSFHEVYKKTSYYRCIV